MLRLLILISLCSLFISSASAVADELPQIILPRTGLTAQDVAVVVNDFDREGRDIARYYQKRRGIPDENMIHVAFVAGKTSMSRKVFARLMRQVKERTPPHVQAYVLTWTRPWRVADMSITTAFAAGYDEGFEARGCTATKFLHYFNSDSSTPYDDFALRPTMMLAGESTASVFSLIERGVKSDAGMPIGTAYLVKTDDKARNVRHRLFSRLLARPFFPIDLKYVEANHISNKRDVLFYFTGIKRVRNLGTLKFLPGAAADHLTSYGGVLSGRGDQMSALEWLEAGATGSYGTVVEPCNILGKFPDPSIMIPRYTKGETLLEAYWKSTAMPGQGVFVGEALARPFGGYRLKADGDGFMLHTRVLRQGLYQLVIPARDDEEAVLVVDDIAAGVGDTSFRFPHVGADVYEIRAKMAGDAKKRSPSFHLR
jgi:uncharacterized protein (TIGR03790 family)